MPRIKLKTRGPPNKEKKLKLLSILCGKEIHVTKVFDANDGFAVLLLNDDHANKIFEKETKKSLEDNGFTPLMPPALKVKKSIILNRLDDIIYEHNEEEIKDEIILKNEWIGDGLENIFKFPNSSTIKMTFNSAALAKRSTEKGLLAFNLSIPTTQIRQETFIPIQTCMRCYQVEMHSTKDCPKPPTYKVCSECSEEGHQWHQCKATTKTCINCGEDHGTMAMKCKLRKEIIREKRKEEQERQKGTYAQAAATKIVGQHATYSGPFQHTTPFITREEYLKINICIAHAHQKNIETPGTYAEELNKVLTANKLPSIIIPETTESTEIRDNAEGNERSKSKSRSRSKCRKTSKPRKNGNEEEITIDQEIEEAVRDKTPKEAMDIDLQFYTPKDIGWPPKNFNAQGLLSGIQQNKY